MSVEAGNILRESRERKGVSVKEASDALHIRIPYLQALENGRTEIIPSAVQARGFLRIYSEYLGLNPTEVIQEWDNPGSTQLSIKPYQPIDPTNPYSAPGATIAPSQNQTPESSLPANIQNMVHPNQPFNNNNGFNNGFPDKQEIGFQNPAIRQTASTSIQPEPVQNIDKPEQETSDSDSSSEHTLPEKSGKKRPGLFAKRKKEPSNKEAPEENAQELFKSIGQELSYRRKFLSLSPEDCESQTLIRSIYLESMENGDFEQLPSLIQARGMLNNYASFLDLDVDAIMLKFATALQLLSDAKNKRDEQNRKKPTKQVGRLKKFFTPDLFIGIFVIVGIAGIIIYSAITITAYRRSISEPTPDLGISLLEQYMDTTRTPEFLPTGSATPIAASSLTNTGFTVNETEDETSELSLSQPVQLFINANQRALMRVVTDGTEVFSGRTIPNNTYPFDAENIIELTVSNGDAVSITYNQQNLGRLGKIGEVMTVIFTQYMAATPTPQFSPTPTNTYEPTYTPQPETPLPTNTPTPYIP